MQKATWTNGCRKIQGLILRYFKVQFLLGNTGRNDYGQPINKSDFT